MHVYTLRLYIGLQLCMFASMLSFVFYLFDLHGSELYPCSQFYVRLHKYISLLLVYSLSSMKSNVSREFSNFCMGLHDIA